MRHFTLFSLLAVLLLPSTQSFGTKNSVFSIQDHGVMSVELMEFYAQYDNTNNLTQIYWTTRSEHESYKFVIERSSDNTTFTEIGEVKGAENSDYIISYSFTDVSPLTGINYYRLKQVAFDYSYAYVQVISLQGGPEEVDVVEEDEKQKNKIKDWITVCPNPVSESQFAVKFHMALEEDIELIIQSANGKVSQTIFVPKGTSELTVNTPEKKGSYFIKASIKGKLYSTRISVKN